MATQLVTGALDALAARPTDQPLMMHLHFIDPHMPYVGTDDLLDSWNIDELPETEFDYSTKSGTLLAWSKFNDLDAHAQAVQLQHMKLRYDVEIHLVDRMVDAFLNSDAFAEIKDDTLVLFFADHGEEFWEHANFNHGYNLFEEQLQVPAAFWWPGGLEPGQVEAMTQHADLLPTLFALFGFEDPGFGGRVVGSKPAQEFTFHDVYRVEKTHQAVTDGRRKLMYRWDGSDENTGPKYYYDLVDDPTEQVNLYDASNSDVVELWDLLLPRVEDLAKRDEDPGAVPLEPGP